MAELSPAQQQLIQQIQEQQHQFQRYLSHTQGHFQSVDQAIQQLPAQVERLRQLQHPYDPDLDQAAALLAQWMRDRPRFAEAIAQGLSQLQLEYRNVSKASLGDSAWLTELQLTGQLRQQQLDLQRMGAKALQWQRQIMSDVAPYSQQVFALDQVVQTRLQARHFLETATFLQADREIPLGAFAVTALHWGPSDHVNVTLYLSDTRLVIESQATESQRGPTRFSQQQVGWERKLLQQWPLETLVQAERHSLALPTPSSATHQSALGQTVQAFTLRFDGSHPDVLVEELTIYSDVASQQVHCLADTLERARHLQRSSSLGVSASVSASASDSVGAAGANLGLSAAAIEEKIQKIEDALLEGRISETTYRELKQKYESLR